MVSSGLPIVFDSQPLPLKRLASSGVLCGWMNSTAPSSSALAQTGWNFGSEKSSPSTLPPIAAPRRPCFLIAVSSCCTARSGNCRVSEAKAPKRSGRAAQSSASFSFCTLTICGRGVAVLAVPERIDRQHLHVDRHRVHFLQTLLDDDEMLGHALDRRQHLVGRVAHQIDGFMEIAVRVNIDGQDALAADLDRQARRPSAGRGPHPACRNCKRRSRSRPRPSRNSCGWSLVPPSIAGSFPLAGRLTRRPILDFIGGHIAKPEAGGQSFSERSRPAFGSDRSREKFDMRLLHSLVPALALLVRFRRGRADGAIPTGRSR